MTSLKTAVADPGAQRVLRMLEGAGHHAYLVGGTVRNALLGAPVTDHDIATSAHPEVVFALAEDHDIKAVPTGIDHGTVTLVLDHKPYEVTTFRRDVATDGRRAVVAFSEDVAEDARRRDFTMNALYATADGALVDPLGGLPDLRARRLRFIDDPEARIREDYLRILRFFRFTAWYGDPEEGLDADGLAACAAHSEGLAQLSAERVTSELLKLLGAADPSMAVAAMAQAGVLHRVLPGADPTGLGPLSLAEDAFGRGIDPLRRLAILGGEHERLRLSRTQNRRIETLRAGMASPDPALILGQTLGEETALDVLTLRSAALAQYPDATLRPEVARGAAAVFPIRASDLPPDLHGREIGEALATLKAKWHASGLTLTKQALLSLL